MQNSTKSVYNKKRVTQINILSLDNVSFSTCETNNAYRKLRINFKVKKLNIYYLCDDWQALKNFVSKLNGKNFLAFSLFVKSIP